MQRTIANFLCTAIFVAHCFATHSSVHADLFEGFDAITDLNSGGTATQVTASGFLGVLRSDPLGSTGIFQGNSGVFSAQTGNANSYAGMNYNNTGDNGTISTWLLSPVFNLNNGDSMSFWTQTAGHFGFADRLEVRLSTAGSSTEVGNSATSVGDFTDLLLTINPNLIDTEYPDIWTEYQLTLSGLSGLTSGRFALRYFVTDAGYLGNNSNYIGIDSFQFTAVPEPSALGLIGLGLIGAIPGWRRRPRS